VGPPISELTLTSRGYLADDPLRVDSDVLNSARGLDAPAIAPISWNEQPPGVGGFGDCGYWVVTKHRSNRVSGWCCSNVQRERRPFTEFEARRRAEVPRNANYDSRFQIPASVMIHYFLGVFGTSIQNERSK
jgi:hypothetical protein